MYKYEMYSATAKGKSHQENQDSVISRMIPRSGSMGNIYLFGVADGVTLTPFGGWVSRWLARRLMQDPIFVADGSALSAQLADYLTDLHEEFLAEFANHEDMLHSAATLSLAVIQGSSSTCFWVGDSPIYVTSRAARVSDTKLISFPDIHPTLQSLTAAFCGDPFNPHREDVRLKKGDTLTIATDGLTHSERRINELYTRQGVSQSTIDTMISESVPFRHSDDCTIAVAHRQA